MADKSLPENPEIRLACSREESVTTYPVTHEALDELHNTWCQLAELTDLLKCADGEVHYISVYTLLQPIRERLSKLVFDGPLDLGDLEYEARKAREAKERKGQVEEEKE